MAEAIRPNPMLDPEHCRECMSTSMIARWAEAEDPPYYPGYVHGHRNAEVALVVPFLDQSVILTGRYRETSDFLEKRFGVPVDTIPAVACVPHGMNPLKDHRAKWIKVVEKCSGHLVDRLTRGAYRLIVAHGAESVRALGIVDKVKSPADIYGSLVEVDLHARSGDTRRSWVMVAPPVSQLTGLPALRKRYLDRLEDVYDHLRQGELPPHTWQYDGRAEVRVVESYEDTIAAFADLAQHTAVAWDVETFGRPWNVEFQVLMLAFAPVGQEYVYAITREALKDPRVVECLRTYLEDESLKKIGQNVMYDENAVFVAWGIRVRGLLYDTLLTRRILDAGLRGDLAVLGITLGIAGHKDDVTDEADAAYTAYRKSKVLPAEVEGDDAATAWVEAASSLPGAKAKKASKSWSLIAVKPDTLATYNARDAYVTARWGVQAHERLMTETRGELMDVWRLTRRGHYAIRSVQRWGMPVSRARLEEADQETEAMAVAALLKAQHHVPEVTEAMLSSTKQLSELLYQRMGLPVLGTTPGGLPSTAVEVLERLRDKAPLVDAILELRAARKVQSAYVRGIMHALRQDGRVHPSYHLGLARSGRMSVSDPPLHQIPRATENDADPGTIARSLFVAHEGFKFVNVDLSQVELRVAAYLSRDAKMIAIFEDNRDIHMEAAKLIAPLAWGVDWEKLTPEKRKEYRSIVKRFVFGLLYGMSTQRLATETKQTEREAARIKEAILGEFTDLRAWTERMIKETGQSCVVRSEWDGRAFRRRFVPEATSLAWGDVQHAKNVAVNGPVQSLANDICLDALIEVVNYVESLPEGVAEVVCTIHDSILLHVRDSAAAEIGEYVRTTMCRSAPMLQVPLVADVEVGQAWHRMTKVEKPKVDAALA